MILLPLRLIGTLVSMVIRGIIRFLLCTLISIAFLWLEPLYIDSTIVRTIPSTLIVSIVIGLFQAVIKPFLSFLPRWVFVLLLFGFNMLLVVTCSNIFGTFEITKLGEVAGFSLLVTILSALV